MAEQEIYNAVFHFQQWLSDSSTTAKYLTEKERGMVVTYFVQNHADVRKWCLERNKYSVDTHHPTMLPYSSFLWQWCMSPEGNVNAAKFVKLPLKQEVRGEIEDCWSEVLGNCYVPFVYKDDKTTTEK